MAEWSQFGPLRTTSTRTMPARLPDLAVTNKPTNGNGYLERRAGRRQPCSACRSSCAHIEDDAGIEHHTNVGWRRRPLSKVADHSLVDYNRAGCAAEWRSSPRPIDGGGGRTRAPRNPPGPMCAPSATIVRGVEHLPRIVRSRAKHAGADCERPRSGPRADSRLRTAPVGGSETQEWNFVPRHREKNHPVRDSPSGRSSGPTARRFWQEDPPLG